MNYHSSIKWAYLYINDDEFHPRKTNITLNDDVSKAAYKELKQNYSALCDALFRKFSEDTFVFFNSSSLTKFDSFSDT